MEMRDEGSNSRYSSLRSNYNTISLKIESTMSLCDRYTRTVSEIDEKINSIGKRRINYI